MKPQAEPRPWGSACLPRSQANAPLRSRLCLKYPYASLAKLVKAFDACKLKFFFAPEACRKSTGIFALVGSHAREAEWVGCAKRPFAGPEQVLDHVGRYTHRVAGTASRR